MSYVQPDQVRVQGVYQSSVDTRSRFVTRTYTHLLGAVLAFTAIEVTLFQTGVAESIATALLSTNWLLVLGGFMVAGWIASHFAHRAESLSSQYLGLGLYVLAQAIIFVPMLYIAQAYAPGAIQSAAVVTLLGFGGLTGVAFWTRKDFSFLSGVLKWGMIMALIAIVASLIFGFELGTFFSLAMVGLAGVAILWDTSNVLHHFPENRYVGAALQLFSSVALMFWYVLRLFMSRE